MVTAVSGNDRVVLVTGANGFVGRSLVPLLRAEGWRVRRVQRQPSPDADVVTIPSIGLNTAWGAALEGVDAVVHLAARVHHPNDDENADTYHTLNTEGTLQLARSAEQAGVSSFIHISSILVNGSTTTGRGPFREDDVPIPRGIYGQSKAAADAGLEALAKSCDMKITVIRPPLIYGAGAQGNFRTLLRAVTLGFPLPFGALHNRRAFLAIDNMTSFIAHRLAHPGSAFDLFLVADAEQISTPDFIRAIGHALGKSPRLFRVPSGLLSLMMAASGRSQALESVKGSLEIDLTKAYSTGWQPPFDLATAMKRAVSPSS